jgi:hypothetical protein
MIYQASINNPQGRLKGVLQYFSAHPPELKLSHCSKYPPSEHDGLITAIASRFYDGCCSTPLPGQYFAGYIFP